MSHKAPAPAVLVGDFGAEDPYNLAIKLEFDFGMRKTPARSQVSAGIVTCPLDVIRMVQILTPTRKSKDHSARRAMQARLPRAFPQ
jgi:hypothetical protein